MEERRNGFHVSDDPALLDVDTIHAFLQGSYWATRIPRAIVEKSLRGSAEARLRHEGKEAAREATLCGGM